MKRNLCVALVLVAAVVLLMPVRAQTQTSSTTQRVPPCLIDTPAQRAIWDRMKAENHPGYQQIKFNTTWDRYADLGRWEMLAAVIDRDAALAQKSFGEVKAATKDWTLVYKGNQSREYAIELAMMYGCLHPYLSIEQRGEFRGYLNAVSEGTLAALRPVDSDQATGTYFGMALADKVLGTTYLSRMFTDPGKAPALNPYPVGGLDSPDVIDGKPTLRGVIRALFEQHGDGGSWPESSEYNLGTTWLAAAGAYWADGVPEAKVWLKARVEQLLFELTPDLKDSHQWGDVQNARVLRLALEYADIWTLYQSFLDADGETALAAQLRQLEADVYAANGITKINPLYARYYYAYNPYGAKQAWREDGLRVAQGTGLALWRHGQMSGMLHCPNWQNGSVDHWQAYAQCDLRIRKEGVWVVDHPIGYGLDQRFMNQVLINGTGPAPEVGRLIASTYIPGKIVFAAGTNAGASRLVNPAFGTPVGTDGSVPYTFTHENMRQVAVLLDGPELVAIVADRVHADDAKLETITTKTGTLDWLRLYPYATQQATINGRYGVTDWVYHTKTKPELLPDGFAADGVRVTRLLPEAVTTMLVDETTDATLSGYIFPVEKRWAVHEVPVEHVAFRLHLRVISTGNVTATRIDAGEMQGVRIARPGLKDVVLFFSAAPGPRLMTSISPPNQWGGVKIRYDRTKLDQVIQGRLVTVKPPAPAGATTYYADMGATLIEAEAPVPTTTPLDLINKLRTLLDELAATFQQVK